MYHWSTLVKVFPESNRFDGKGELLKMSSKGCSNEKKQDINAQMELKTKVEFIEEISIHVSEMEINSSDDDIHKLINKINSNEFRLYMDSVEIKRILDIPWDSIDWENIELRKDITLLFLDKLNKNEVFDWFEIGFSNRYLYEDEFFDGFPELCMILIQYFDYKMYISPAIFSNIIEGHYYHCKCRHSNINCKDDNVLNELLNTALISIQNCNKNIDEGIYSEAISSMLQRQYCINCYTKLIDMFYKYFGDNLGMTNQALNYVWMTRVLLYFRGILKNSYESLEKWMAIRTRKAQERKIRDINDIIKSCIMKQPLSFIDNMINEAVNADHNEGKFYLLAFEFGMRNLNQCMDTIFPYFDEYIENYNSRDNVDIDHNANRLLSIIMCIVKCQCSQHYGDSDDKQIIVWSAFQFEHLSSLEVMIYHISLDDSFTMHLIRIFYEKCVAIITEYKYRWFKTEKGKKIFRNYVNELKEMLDVDLSIAYTISTLLLGQF